MDHPQEPLGQPPTVLSPRKRGWTVKHTEPVLLGYCYPRASGDGPIGDEVNLGVVIVIPAQAGMDR